MHWVATGNSGTGSSGSPVAKKTKTEQKKKNEHDKTPPAYRAALTQLARLSRDVESLKSIAYVSLRAPSKHTVTAAGVGAGKAYSAAVKAEGKGHNQGKPHCHVFGAMCKEVVKDMQPGNPQTPIMQNFVNSIKKPQDLEKMVQFCMARPQHKGEYTKISWNITAHTKEVSEIIIARSISGGAEQHFGAAPRNPHERKIAQFLSRNKKGEGEEEEED